jgi:alpha-glucosidase
MKKNATKSPKKKDGPWWKEGVIYQIYPRSFHDTDGDGVGDLPGVIEKLDYLSDLGIDGIWLSPINTSPMFDFGYDVSDYRAIDPVFGTLKDFDRLIKEAHRRGIRIVMDLVMNHSSHLHPWFLESRSSRNNPKRDWYIWRDGVKGKAPNNWMAYFGGRAWEWDEATGQYYLHSFLKEQPDLNWRNPALKKAAFAEIGFWLDRGVDGFRLDVVNFFIKDDGFRSNPFGIGRYPRPYDLQKHVYDRDRPELKPLLREWRALLDRYRERMMVGEVVAEDPNPALAASYLGDGTDGLHLSFDFSFMNGDWGADLFRKRLKAYHDRIPEKGWPCTVFSNHDQVRSYTRYAAGADSLKRAKIIAMLLLAMRGTPFIYYGEEIGMKNGRIRRREIQDPVGKKYWPFNSGRDGERTPMQWSAGTGAGFTAGTPWLPPCDNYREVNAERQAADTGSLLSFYRGLIALRRESPALRRGGVLFLESGRDVLAFLREEGDERLLVALNFSSGEKPFIPELGERPRAIFSTHRRKGEGLDGKMRPYEATVFSLGASGA